MKIIIISGSYSGIGKTTLAKNIKNALGEKGVEIIKFGHNSHNLDKQERLFLDMVEGVDFIQSLQVLNEVDYLIIESNSIYKFIKPDLSIFLEGKDKAEKKSAEPAKMVADIIINEQFDYNQALITIKDKLKTDVLDRAILEQYKYIYNK